MLFNEKKAAHVAAFLLHRGNGKLDVLKLMKLMYLAERESLAKFGEPIIGDWLCSMEHGPALSRTLNHINGIAYPDEGDWDAWVSDRENHTLALNKPVNNPQKDLSSLSDADLQILDELWAKHGHLTGYQLRDLTHEICTEWEEPEQGSSTPIPYMRILRRLGHSADTAAELNLRFRSQRGLETILKNAA